jgi:hypothetical protein
MATPTGFAPTFPCFSVLDKTFRVPCCVKSISGVGLVVLTDDDLLDRFRRNDAGAVGPVVRCDSAPQLLLYLDSLPEWVTHVAFDPTETNQAVLVDFKTFYDAVLGAM